MAFRIAKPAVVFDQLRACRGQHQPCIQHAGIGHSLCGHRIDGGDDDFFHRAFLQRWGEDGRRGISAHAASVRPRVALAYALVILRCAKGDDGLAIGDCKEAGLLAFQKFLDDDFCASRTEMPAKHISQRRLCICAVFGNDHAFACGQPVGFQNIGRREFVECSNGVCQIGEPNIAAGGDASARTHILSEALAPLKLRGGGGRSKHGNIFGAQTVSQAVHQRSLRPNHHQIDRIGCAKIRHCIMVTGIQRRKLRAFFHSGIAGACPQAFTLRRLRQLPR